MKKYISDENCCPIDPKEYHDYRNRVHNKYPVACKERFEYAEKIMTGKMYMYYVITELQDATMITLYPSSKVKMNKIVFSTEDIEMFLRAMAFMFEHSNDNLPEHNYDYMKEKSEGFFNQLFDKVKENIDL